MQGGGYLKLAQLLPSLYQLESRFLKAACAVYMSAPTCNMLLTGDSYRGRPTWEYTFQSLADCTCFRSIEIYTYTLTFVCMYVHVYTADCPERVLVA